MAGGRLVPRRYRPIGGLGDWTDRRKAAAFTRIDGSEEWPSGWLAAAPPTVGTTRAGAPPPSGAPLRTAGRKGKKEKKTKELLQQPRTEEPGIVYQRRGSVNRVSDPIIIIDTSTKNASLITPQ